jgi:hypothetical protein
VNQGASTFEYSDGLQLPRNLTTRRETITLHLGV